MATLVGRNNHMRCCDQRWHRNISVNECKEGKSSFDCQVSWPRVPTRTTEIWVRCRLGNDMQWCTTHWYPAAPVRQKCQQPDHSQLRWFAQTASDADYWSRDISTDPTSAWNFSCDSGDVFFFVFSWAFGSRVYLKWQIFRSYCFSIAETSRCMGAPWCGPVARWKAHVSSRHAARWCNPGGLMWVWHV